MNARSAWFHISYVISNKRNSTPTTGRLFVEVEIGGPQVDCKLVCVAKYRAQCPIHHISESHSRSQYVEIRCSSGERDVYQCTIISERFSSSMLARSVVIAWFQLAVWCRRPSMRIASPVVGRQHLHTGFG